MFRPNHPPPSFVASHPRHSNPSAAKPSIVDEEDECIFALLREEELVFYFAAPESSYRAIFGPFHLEFTQRLIQISSINAFSQLLA